MFHRSESYQLKDLSQIPLLPWELNGDFLLSGTPLHAQDGDLFLFKDNTESEKVPLDALQDGAQSKLNINNKSVKIPEPSVVIRTKWDRVQVTNEDLDKIQNDETLIPKEA